MPLSRNELLDWGWMALCWGIGKEPEENVQDWFMTAFSESAERLDGRRAFESLEGEIKNKLIVIGRQAAKLAGANQVTSKHIMEASVAMGQTPLCPPS